MKGKALIITMALCKGICHEPLALDIISYDAFVQEDPDTLALLNKALYEKGIVGIRGIPGYREKVDSFIETARQFSALPEEVKEKYAPNHALGETFLGYEMGKERFQNGEGEWVIDDLKTSYYGFVPDSSLNKWPTEVNLRDPFQALGGLMSEIGKAVMEKIHLIGAPTGIYLENTPRIGRLLYYHKHSYGVEKSPLWCGAHFDHGIFTALLPAFYFVNGEPVPEPEEAGLFIKEDDSFKKVVANDPEVLLFQVGEFGQLATNDAIRATKHKVQKALIPIERYTMALFFDAPMESFISSFSELTSDSRYGAAAGEPCSYGHWHEESFKRYLVTEENP